MIAVGPRSNNTSLPFIWKIATLCFNWSFLDECSSSPIPLECDPDAMLALHANKAASLICTLHGKDASLLGVCLPHLPSFQGWKLAQVRQPGSFSFFGLLTQVCTQPGQAILTFNQFHLSILNFSTSYG